LSKPPDQQESNQTNKQKAILNLIRMGYYVLYMFYLLTCGRRALATITQEQQRSVQLSPHRCSANATKLGQQFTAVIAPLV